MVRKREALGLRILNTIFFVLMVAVNIIAEWLPLNNITTAQVSAKHDTLMTPPGFTFIIWGVIYLGLFLFVLYQNGVFLKRGEGENPDIVHAVSIFFIISSAGNIAWVIAWHYDYIVLCFVLIFAIWGSLLLAYIRLQKEIKNRRERFFVQVPFSIYLAWISIAMAPNLLAMLKSSTGFLGLTELQWTMAAVICLALFTEYNLFMFRDIAFALTAGWAFGGIFYRYVQDIGTPNLQTDMMVLLSAVMGVLLMSLLIVGWMQHYKPQMTQGSGHRNFNH
ncbi:MAG: hypothetical protein WCG21_06795 [Eubacteriales bacterium]